MSIRTAVGGCTTEESEFELTMGKTFSVLHSFHTSYGFHLACYRMGSSGYFRRIKCQELELSHAHLGVKVKDPRSCTSTSPHIFITWCSVQQKKNTILPLLFTRQIFFLKKGL